MSSYEHMRPYEQEAARDLLNQKIKNAIQDSQLPPEVVKELLKNLTNEVEHGIKKHTPDTSTSKSSQSAEARRELSQEVAKLVDSYNQAALGTMRDFIQFEQAQHYKLFFTVVNARQRAQNRDLPPEFGKSESGPHMVIGSSAGEFFVFPKLGKSQSQDTAFEHFYKNATNGSDFKIKKPARCEVVGDQLRVIEKGELEV